MPPLPSRKALEAMKRTDLQQLCKNYGVRANLKSEALIDLLLETQSAPQPPPSRRASSTQRSTRAGPSRTSSIIIHDLDEDIHDDDTTMLKREPSLPAEPQPQPIPTPAPARTRKAKDLQTSLGVGRPTLVGGAGARAVTRASSTQRSRRGKSSRMLSRVEPTIEEEPEPTAVERTATPAEQPSNGSPIPLDLPDAGPAASTSSASAADISKKIFDAVEPLRIQLKEMHKVLHALDQRNSEVMALRSELNEFKQFQGRYSSLEAEVKALRLHSSSLEGVQEELKQLKESLNERTPPLPSTPKARSPRIPLANRGVVPSAFKSTVYPPIADDTSPLNSPRREGSAAPKLVPHPGLPPTTLGKRPRDSVTSDLSGILEEGQVEGFPEEELARKVTRPNKKRPRLSSTEPSHAGPSNKEPSNDVAAQLTAPRIPSFTVYTGPEDDFGQNYDDPPPPTNALPDFFAPPSPDDENNQEENQQPFNFNFVPMSSTPAHPTGPTSFMPPFPFPEAPHSPSPVSTSIGYLGRASDHRTDIFKSFGLPSPRRPRLPESDDTVNPSAIAGQSNSAGKQREVSSNDVAAGLRLTMAPTTSSSDPGTNAPELPPARKTMYGTELESETRFGDFGVEGVASGFWTGR